MEALFPQHDCRPLPETKRRRQHQPSAVVTTAHFRFGNPRTKDDSTLTPRSKRRRQKPFAPAIVNPPLEQSASQTLFHPGLPPHSHPRNARARAQERRRCFEDQPQSEPERGAHRKKYRKYRIRCPTPCSLGKEPETRSLHLAQDQQDLGIQPDEQMMCPRSRLWDPKSVDLLETGVTTQTRSGQTPDRGGRGRPEDYRTI